MSGKVVNARVLGTTPNYDLVVLQIRAPRVMPPRWSSAAPPIFRSAHPPSPLATHSVSTSPYDEQVVGCFEFTTMRN